MITDEKASMKLSNLAQKENEEQYTYYHPADNLLKGIHGWDQIINSDRDTLTLNPAKQ